MVRNDLAIVVRHVEIDDIQELGLSRETSHVIISQESKS